MENRKIRLVLISWLGAFMGLSSSAKADKLRVCIGDFPPYAIGLDFLQKNAQQIELSQSTVYACSVRFKKNYFDLVLGDSFIYVTNYLDDPDSRIISLVDYSDGVDQIIVQKDSDTSKIAGSRWALQKGTVSSVLLSLYLRSMRLTLRNVVLEDVKVENTPQAIGKTRFFGVVNWQPYARQAMQRGGRVLATSADFPDKFFDFIITRKSVMTKFRPLIEAYVTERLKRARNAASMREHYAALKKIPIAQAAADLEGLHIYSLKSEVVQDKERLLRSLRLAAEVADSSQYSGTLVQDLLKKREREIFDPSLLEEKSEP